MKLSILVCALLILFQSCTSKQPRKRTTSNKHTDSAGTIEQPQYQDTIAYDTVVVPGEFRHELKLLTTGVFHEDEVWEGVSTSKWLGLFKGPDRFYLAPAIVKTKRVYDIVVDENETDRTGWEVTTLGDDTNCILIEPLPYLTERTKEQAVIPSTVIQPGDTVHFSYQGRDYTLYATGGKREIGDEPQFYEVWNYKLYITGNDKTQLLIAHSQFDDSFIEILFAGDIDGDGILDLIIDDSPHYNMFNPTLFLSKPAKGGELLKPVGAHTSVGC